MSKTLNFSTASSDFRLSLSNLPLFPRKVGGSKFEVAGFLASCRHLMRTLCNDTPLCQISFLTQVFKMTKIVAVFLQIAKMTPSCAHVMQKQNSYVISRTLYWQILVLISGSQPRQDNITINRAHKVLVKNNFIVEILSFHCSCLCLL